MLAYFDMLSRDASRFRQARERTDVMPLGSGALRARGRRRVGRPEDGGAGDQDLRTSCHNPRRVRAVHATVNLDGRWVARVVE